ncbi:MAG: aminotransferase class IV [Gammaproteobacteria bacterium]|nr:aminotransferase class IV [Gammaproteobacteria bacterium]
MSEARATSVERTIWRDGHFVAWRDATVHVLAQSLQRGSLAFDYLSVYETARGPAAFRLRDHVERLATTCRIVGLPLAYPVETLVEAAAETVRRNHGAKSVKISALIPSVEVELVPQDERVSVFIAAYDSGPDIIAHNPGEYRRRDVLSLKIEREKSARREDILPPHAKVGGNYTAAMTAKWRARREGFDDVVLLDENGFVTEGPTANLFLVDADGRLATPPANKVLLGITRDSVIRLARANGIHCAERDITPDELTVAAEVFLTGTSVGVWPVLRVDGGAVASGDVGPMTTRLRDRYRAVVRGEDPDFQHWLHYI